MKRCQASAQHCVRCLAFPKGGASSNDAELSTVISKQKKKKNQSGTFMLVYSVKMAHLETLNSFLCDRLMAAAAEIFQVVKDTVSQYQEEIERSKQENIYLRKMLAEVSINNGPGE